MLPDKFTKYMTWSIDIALIITIVLFSKYYFLFKALIIDSFIFSKDEILYYDETSKGFTIVLTERRKVIIKDKKAKVFLQEILK